MRYAIVSDIHANIQAWEAVLKDIQKQGVDAILCLGDVIGYGPNPVEVLESCHQHVDYFVLGNHDAVVGDRMDSSLFNDSAKYLIEWTRNQLSGEAAGFFARMPLKMEGQTFACAHAEHALPGRFSYLYEADDCISSFDATRQQILFVGHTHMQTKFTWSEGRLLQGKNEDFTLKEGDRYLVNAGSVGDPRDGKTFAQYIIYDETKKTLQYKSIPFDIQGFKINLAKAKLPVTPFFVMIDEGLRKEAETIKDMEVMAENQVSSSDTEISFFDKDEMLETRTRRLTRSINFSPETMKKIQTHKAKVEESRTRGFEEKKKNSKALALIIILLLTIATVTAVLYLLGDKKPDSRKEIVPDEKTKTKLNNNIPESSKTVPAPANDSLLSYEGFDYQNRNMNGIDRGSQGWAEKWSVSAGALSTVESTSLQYTDANNKRLLVSGDHLLLPANTSVYRPLDVSKKGSYKKQGFLNPYNRIAANNKTVYISFLMEVDENSKSLDIAFTKINRQEKSLFWSLSKHRGNIVVNSNKTRHPVHKANSATYLYVIRADYQPGNHSLKIYVNPELGTEPEKPDTSISGTGLLTFDSLSISCGESSEVRIDELRIGPSYKSVTPH